MSMAEEYTYIDQLADVADKAFTRWFFDKPNDLTGSTEMTVEAVAAQVLRDLVATMDDEFEPRLSGWVRDWASDRGIELKGDRHEQEAR